MGQPDERHPLSGKAQAFATTHWSIVLAAGDTKSPGSEEALEKLCQAYWYPLYAYIRHKGRPVEDAQDLTQDFFARFLAKKYFKLPDPARGRFRSFLLTSLNHFMVHEWEKAKAAKRGGGREIISWDHETAENRYHLEPSSLLTPETLFDRRWALTLFERGLDQLKREFVAAGKAEQFERLKEFLSGETSEGGYSVVASEMRSTPKTIGVMVHRLRSRYAELVRTEIAQTVSTPGEIEQELRYLVGLAAQGE